MFESPTVLYFIDQNLLESIIETASGLGKCLHYDQEERVMTVFDDHV